MEHHIQCTYTSDSQVTIQTNQINDVLHTIHDGSGRYVTPGDMLVAALGACTLTMIGAVAQKYKHNMDGLQIQLTPTFGPNLSGLQKIDMHLIFPPSIPAEMHERYITAAYQCPVHNSLNPAIEFNITAQ